MIHYTPEFFSNPEDPITICVIGAGGTGSQVITQLARINEVLKQIGHRGIHCTLFDDDIINEHNVGKQLFSRSEIGEYKASSIITRLNRFYGTEWVANNERMRLHKSGSTPNKNIIITCIDKFEFRSLFNILKDKEYREPNTANYAKRCYWIDIGNENDFGQIFLSTVGKHKQLDTSGQAKLLSAFDIFPKAKIDKAEEQISCSMAESLMKQDLFINSILAQYAAHMVWSLLNKPFLDYQGIFVNLRNLNTSKYSIYEPACKPNRRTKTNSNRKTSSKVG